MSNIAQFLKRSADLYPDKAAIVCGETRISYEALLNASSRIASGLIKSGIEPGDRIAISCPNLPQFLMVYFGILSTGAAVVPVNILLRSHEIAYQLKDSKAKAFFCFEGLPELPTGETGLQAFKDTESCQSFYAISLDSSKKSWNGEATMTSLLANTPLASPIDRNSDDTAIIFYTSGTTGAPKGAELTQSNIGMNILALQGFLKSDANDSHLIVLPIFHAFAQIVQMNLAVACGQTQVLVPKFDPQDVLLTLAKERVTIFAGVPTMYIALNTVAASAKPETIQIIKENLRMGVSGGAAMPVEVMRQFETQFGVDILEGYGLSETSPVATFNSLDQERIPGSVGRAIAGVEVKVIDDNGNTLPVGEQGEIVVKGHNIMKGYLNSPEKTADAIRNGWFHTGDIGRMDEAHNLYIVDRLKDLIIRGGYNVYPRELEEVLLTHPEVMMAAVVGTPHEHFGEEIMACLVLKPGASASADEIQAWGKEQLGSHKYPRTVRLFEALPMTATGKILKREIRDQLLNEAETEAV